MPKIGNPQLLFPSVRSFEDCHQISPKNYIRVGIRIHNLSMMSLLLLPLDLRTLPIRYNYFFYKNFNSFADSPLQFFLKIIVLRIRFHSINFSRVIYKFFVWMMSSSFSWCPSPHLTYVRPTRISWRIDRGGKPTANFSGQAKRH